MISEEINIKGFLNYIYDSYKTMSIDKIRLVYEGEISHQIIKAFLVLTESELVEIKESSKTQKKLVNIMVESLQNITKHGADIYNECHSHNTTKRGIVLLEKHEKEYFFTTGNLLRTASATRIENKLKYINSLDKDQLKDAYIKQLKDGKHTSKGGAGLGFIDIARKTGEKIDFKITEISNKFSILVLTMKVPRNI